MYYFIILCTKAKRSNVSVYHTEKMYKFVILCEKVKISNVFVYHTLYKGKYK